MTLNADTPKIPVEWKGMTEFNAEMAKLAAMPDSFNPKLEIVGIVQTALDQLTLKLGADKFKQTGLRVGTQERIDVWEANPKVVVNHPDDFLRDIEKYMNTHPESHADLQTLADTINQWFADNA